MKASLNRMCRSGLAGRRFGLVLAFAALAGAVAVMPSGAQEAPIKIAVVDLEFVVAQSPGGRALQAKLQQFSEQINAEVTNRREAAQALNQQITQGQNSLSAERLTKLQQELEDAQIGIKRYQDDKQREGQKMQSDGLRGIEAELKPVFEAITAERGYDLILNNVPGVIVLAGPRADITQLVVDRLNATAAAATDSDG